MDSPGSPSDFRSDTVTRPTPEMREAMANAVVGDDVYGEDPTVRTLEEQTAEVAGMEAALFVPSGIMANQLAVNLHTRPGDEVLCDEWAHLRGFELGAASSFSGVSFRTVDNGGGLITAADVQRLGGGSPGRPSAVRMVDFENTHNASGGQLLPLEEVTKAVEVAHQLRLAVHIDGARIWNAVEASGDDLRSFGAAADTMSVCFSKGLGAPVGSALCGSGEFISRARPLRRKFGGAMRQAGILAAAALIGLRDRNRLAEDHTLARTLAAGLQEHFPGSVGDGPTNMVTLSGPGLSVGADQLIAAFRRHDVLVGEIRPGVVRFVTHRDVGAADVERVLVAAAALGRG